LGILKDIRFLLIAALAALCLLALKLCSEAYTPESGSAATGITAEPVVVEVATPGPQPVVADSPAPIEVPPLRTVDVTEIRELLKQEAVPAVAKPVELPVLSTDADPLVSFRSDLDAAKAGVSLFTEKLDSAGTLVQDIKAPRQE